MNIKFVHSVINGFVEDTDTTQSVVKLGNALLSVENAYVVANTRVLHRDLLRNRHQNGRFRKD